MAKEICGKRFFVSYVKGTTDVYTCDRSKGHKENHRHTMPTIESQGVTHPAYFSWGDPLSIPDEPEAST